MAFYKKKSLEGREFHNNNPGEFAALTEKESPGAGDLVVIEDSGDSNNKKKVQVGNLPGGGGGGDGFISPTFTGTYTDQDTFGSVLASREAFWIRFYCRANVNLSAVSFWANAAPDDVRLRVARVTGGTGNSTVAEVLHNSTFQAVSAPDEVAFTSLSVSLSTDTLYAFICEVETGSGLTLRAAQSDERYLVRGDGALVAAGVNGSGHCARDVAVSGTLTAFTNSLIVAKLAYS